jgi:large subunit ribosomal protein L15
MPLQRRLPKYGFRSRQARYGAEVRLSEIASLGAADIGLDLLIEQGVVRRGVRKVKVIASGVIATAVTLRGLKVTRGARVAIEAVGGVVVGK